MRLSVVFELLLVFLFLAFAAARVIDSKNTTKNVAKGKKKATTLRQGPPNRYCACTSRMCNCCRDFSLPVVPIKGPGCASIMYVQKDTMMVTMSFGDRVLSNTTISGKSPKPVCMALPGGISQFCGRIYGISRKGDQFKACLGLELRALDDIEAALRVSCFNFGPKGVRLESAPPVPAGSSSATGSKKPDDDDDDDYDLDDDDDLIGFGDDDDDDDGSSNEDNEVDSDSVDYTGFSVLGEDILGTFFSDDGESSSSKKKKPNKKTAKPQLAAQTVSTTTGKPVLPSRRRPTTKPETVSRRPAVRPVIKRPRPTSAKPLNVVKPSAPSPAVIATQQALQTTSLPSSAGQISVNKHVITWRPTTIVEIPTTIPQAPTVMHTTTMRSHEKEKEHFTSEEVSEMAMVQTEAPVTFTIPPKYDDVKNDIKIPQIDLAKVEAVAAIAQQDVTSGVITTSIESNKEKQPNHSIKNTTPYPTVMTDKIKFFPTTIVSLRPKPTVGGGQSMDDLVNGEITSNTYALTSNSKKKITLTHQHTTEVSSDNEEDSNEDESEEGKEPAETNDKLATNSIKKKKPVKQGSEEDDEDLLDGVLNVDVDNEETEGEEEEEQENDENIVNVTQNAVTIKDKEKDEKETVSSNSQSIFIPTQNSAKPTRIIIKKKPAASTESESEEEEEEEEEVDILDTLGDDDDDDDDGDEDENEEEEEEEEQSNEQESNTNKKKIIQAPPGSKITIRRPTTQTVTHTLVKKPGTQKIQQTRKPITTTEKVAQTILTRKPVPTTEKVAQIFITRKPITTTERMVQTVTRRPVTTTEKVFTFTEPEEKFTEIATEKIIIYKEPVKQNPKPVFIYKDPSKVNPSVLIYKPTENKNTEHATEKVIIYNEPTETVTEKFILFTEPVKLIANPKPSTTFSDVDKSSSEENIKGNSHEHSKEVENEEEESSEEVSDEVGEKHTLMASIINDKPGFSNKYAEEHDLTDNDGYEVEDSDDEGNEFEEDRKLKEHKKKNFKTSSSKPKNNVNKPKTITLSDLIKPIRRYYDRPFDNRAVNSSRTHRRMNLDSLLPLTPTV